MGFIGRTLLALPALRPVLGYENSDLVEIIYRKTIAYVPRDEHWPEIQGAQAVIDFGGGCGLHYKLARLVEPNIRWAVVETPSMADRASSLATDRLNFFTDIESATRWLGSVDLVHSNGAVQYTPDPLGTVAKLCAVNASRMLWRRLFLSDRPIREMSRSLLAHHGPGFNLSARSVIVSRTSILESDFIRAHTDYDMFKRGADWFDFVRSPSTDR